MTSWTWAMICAGAASCVFAVAMVFQRSLYWAALCLLGVVGSSAALFMLSGAPLVGFLQLMIYAGAVMVLIVITIMASRPAVARFADLTVPRPLAALAGLALLGELLALAAKSAGVAGSGAPPGVPQARLGPVLFSSYALATEAVTLLLFISALAVLGARRAE